MKFKHKVDAYFELDGNPSGQVMYYGTLGLMFVVVMMGTLGSLFQK